MPVEAQINKLCKCGQLATTEMWDKGAEKVLGWSCDNEQHAIEVVSVRTTNDITFRRTRPDKVMIVGIDHAG